MMGDGNKPDIWQEACSRAPRQLLIDGRFVASRSGDTFDTVNPATGQVLGSVAKGAPGDIDAAVAAARRALSGEWARFTPYERQKVLLRLADLVDQHFDDLARLDVLDMGVPISAINQRRTRVVSMLRFYASMAVNISGRTIGNSLPGNVSSRTVREPVGVVGAINPWNSPLGLSVWKVAPALAAGCTIILKPAEQAPLSPLRFGELCLEAGIPPGVVNIVPGYGDAGQALAEHPGVDKIAFTGSTSVGQSIIRASAGNVKRVSLELGGKSPNIIFDDADLDRAIPGAAMAIFANSGQNCLAGSRLFVHRSVCDEVLEGISRFAAGLRVDDPRSTETQLGPVVSDGQLHVICDYIAKGKAEGADLVEGGGRLSPSGLEAGSFVAPTIFSGVTDEMTIAREEIFGPVVSVMPFDDEAEVVQRANRVAYGLASGIWTQNIDRVQRVSANLQAGTVWVNCYGLLDVAVPFGGYKMSGYGRESGEEHMEEYLNTKTVMISAKDA